MACLICNRKLYDNSICDNCKPVVDKVLELRKKDRKWFEALYDRNSDFEYNYYDSLNEEEKTEYYMSRDKFVSILMDLLK